MIPAKVILFDSHATGRWVEHRYIEGGQLKTPGTVIIHDIDFVNKMLSQGQYFFTDIEKEGILLYDAGNTPLADRKPLSPAEAKAIVQNHFDQWLSPAKGFLKGADFYLQEKEYKLSAFELHQATERTYNAIILVHTGYKPKTHNLDKLKRYSKRFSQELDAVFPDNTPEEKHLFDLLKRGYIDTRYKDSYEITAEELTTLIERVGKLQAIAERLCQEKIASHALSENSKIKEVLLGDSLGKVEVAIPIRYDTMVEWIDRSDCGKPCEKQKYRLQSKTNRITMESGFFGLANPRTP